MIKCIGKCLLIEENGEKVLVIGDVHLGAGGREIGGIDVEGEMEKEMLFEFDEIFVKVKELSVKGSDMTNNKTEESKIGDKNKEKTVDKNLEGDMIKMVWNNDGRAVNKVILLGDLKHEFSGLTEGERYGIVNLLDYLQTKTGEIIIIRGNHDNYLLNILSKRGIKVWNYYLWKNYCFLHGDKDYKEIHDKKIRYWIMGHLHPSITFSEGPKTEKYKCFLNGKFKGKEIIILPSFDETGDGINVADGESNLAWAFDLKNFNVKVVGEKLESFEFGKLKKLI